MTTQNSTRKTSYSCSCTQGCKGHLRTVSKSTYQRHTRYRENDALAAGQRSQNRIPNLAQPRRRHSPDDLVSEEAVAPSGLSARSSRNLESQDQEENTNSSLELHDKDRSHPTPSPTPDCIDQGIQDAQSANGPQESSTGTPDSDLEYVIKNISQADLRTAVQFIEAMQSASLESSHSGMTATQLHRLRNPPTTPFDFDADLDLKLGIEMFLSSTKSSVDTYNTMRDAFHRRHPEDHIPSYEQIKRRITDITGINSIVFPMCKNSCLAFTGPFASLDKCPRCQEPKICPITKKPQQEFHTIPIGPVIQALWRDPSSAKRFSYRRSKNEEIIENLEANSGSLPFFEDFFDGSDYLENLKNGRIKDDDIVLMLSMDGAQLYAHKASDCWIYIWVIFDLSPDERYQKKHVIPGGFIPGPNKPKLMDSFVFPGLYHLAAIQIKGLRIWNGLTGQTFICRLFLGLATADGPGMAYLNGLVGHHGKFGCRLYCPVSGRHKPHGSHYYPALLKPIDYAVQGCDHDDISYESPAYTSPEQYFINLRYLLESPNDTQYKKRRLETGISKPTIFLGLPTDAVLGIPGCFGSDIMHLASFNVPDLLISLWRGTIDRDNDDPLSTWPWAVLRGDTWQVHGKQVAAATPYLPGSFDRPPRNIAEKLNSGYKAWEFLIYLYGLAPALLHGVLPEPFYGNFCKLVVGMRIVLQRRIRADDLKLADHLLRSFAHEFEELYYQRNVGRLHFVRQSIHALTHLASEVCRLGPPICSSQWTMERTIGNLGEEIRQPSNPFANLSQRGWLRCQINAITSMLPDIQQPASWLPQGAVDLENGYALLRAQDQFRPMLPQEARALLSYLSDVHGIKNEELGSPPEGGWCPDIARWARLRLPNGQVARSRWKEQCRPLNKIRISRNVKFNLNGKTCFGEVYYFFRCRARDKLLTLAVISKYSEHHEGLHKQSHGAVLACRYLGEDALVVVEYSNILSVVAMIPHNFSSLGMVSDSHSNSDPEANVHYFAVERPGLDISNLATDLHNLPESDSDE